MPIKSSFLSVWKLPNRSVLCLKNLPWVPMIGICKWARPVAMEDVIEIACVGVIVLLDKKSNKEPFSWKSVTNHNWVHVPISENKTKTHENYRITKTFARLLQIWENRKNMRNWKKIKLACQKELWNLDNKAIKILRSQFC